VTVEGSERFALTGVRFGTLPHGGVSHEGLAPGLQTARGVLRSGPAAKYGRAVLFIGIVVVGKETLCGSGTRCSQW
jgi:hypothetical protein